MSRGTVEIEFCRIIFIRALERYVLGAHADIEALFILQGYSLPSTETIPFEPILIIPISLL